MGKGLRSKVKKRARSVLRWSVGTAQADKATRQALRRLAASVAAQGGGAALMPRDDGRRAIIAVPAGPPRTRPQRFTFNAAARAARVAAGLDDLTDDELDVRLGRVDALAAATRAARGMAEEDAAEAAAEAAAAAAAEAEAAAEAQIGGRAWAPGRGERKHGTDLGSGRVEAPPEDAPVGFYETDPALRGSGRAARRRAGKTRGH